eukprot:scaffold480317_cov26-Prasinocladus_malaysianus.AAC.1
MSNRLQGLISTLTAAPASAVGMPPMYSDRASSGRAASSAPALPASTWVSPVRAAPPMTGPAS